MNIRGRLPSRRFLLLPLLAIVWACSPGDPPETTLEEAASPFPSLVITGQLPEPCAVALQRFFDDVEPIVQSVDWDAQTPQEFVSSDVFSRVSQAADNYRSQFDECVQIEELVFQIADLKAFTTRQQPGSRSLLDLAQQGALEGRELAAAWCPGFPLWPRGTG